MPWSTLAPLLGEAAAGGTIDRLKTLAAELLRWNQNVSNLVSHADEPRLIDRHFRESLLGLEWVRRLRCTQLVDFGSGGGFPALPLALAEPGLSWTLVESRRNKTLFLRKMVEVLEIRGMQVVTGRLEMLLETDREALTCDGFTSRATMKLEPTLEMAAAIVRPGGHAILWKGSGLAEEVLKAEASIGDAWNAVATTPIGDGPNSISVFQRK
jgi:16S rRNA (guanine527-N7)-methyltransferase